MFEKVVDLLSWRKKKDSNAQVVTVEAPKAPDAPATAPSDVSARSIGDLNALEYEAMWTRVEVAKKVAETKEHHDGVNRNRRNRLIRAVGIVAAIGALFAFLPDDSTKRKIPIDKVAGVGAVFPVVGALPGATKKGNIAVIRVAGGIGGTLHGPAVVANTPLYLDTALRAVEEDPDLAGVILEIDSPGGGVAASEQSYRIVKAAAERLAKRKVRMIAYTSLGAYSGGYYIAMGVGHGNFYADPAAAVANIGVIMSMLNTSGLGELLGITEHVITTGPMKSTGAQWEKLTPEQRAMLQESIDDSFRAFLAAVSESRKIDATILMKESQTATGRTNGAWFSARRALDKKLIDGIIPVEDLYKANASILPDKQKFREVEIVEYRARMGILEQFTNESGRLSGVFMRNFWSEMTHRDQPARFE